MSAESETSYRRLIAEALFSAYSEEGPSFPAPPTWMDIGEPERRRWIAVAVEALSILGRPSDWLPPPPSET